MGTQKKTGDQKEEGFRANINQSLSQIVFIPEMEYNILVKTLESLNFTIFYYMTLDK